ncbi:glycosyltransferase family 52 [Parabacteroides sp.]
MKLFKRYKSVAYLPTPYTLLQYLLLSPCRVEDTLFFMHQWFPLLFARNLPESDFLQQKSIVQQLASVFKIYWMILRNPELPLYLGGNLFFTNVFLRYSKNPIYLEDGVGSYELVLDKMHSVRTKRRRFYLRPLLGDLYPWHGLADHVRKIYLTGILPIPEVIADKVEIINLKQLWLQKTKEQQEEIIRIFLPSDFDRGIIREYDVFLITQPFSEFSDGSFSEENKIEVYRKLVSPYDESCLVIKKHPAETTDYRKYFPKARIIDLPCPLELLVFMGLSAKTALSINSTAIFGIDAFQEKIVSGYDVTPALIRECKRNGLYGGISNHKQKIQSNSKK